MEFLYGFDPFPLEFLCMQEQISPENELGFLRCFDAGQSSGSLSGSCWHVQNYARSILMMDVVMVALAVGFFAVSIAYVYACEQL